MQRDELDRLLSDEKVISPSAGFLEAVMNDVLREAEALPKLGFPFKPVLAALVTAAFSAILALSAGPESSSLAATYLWIERGTRELALASTSATAVSLLLAITVTLIPLVVYELMMSSHGRASGASSP